MRRACTRGFTLAEVLVAVAILALMGTLTLGTFSSALDARERVGAVSEHYHVLRQAMNRMSREISMAFLTTHRNCQEPETRTIFRGRRGSGGARLDFTSFSHTKTQMDVNESDQNELSYFVRQEDGRGVLVRREQSRIDEEPDEGGSEHVLAENVEGLEFEFYDAKDDRWIEDWDTERADFRNRLPAFVRIALKTKDLAGRDETFRSQTRVFIPRAIYIAGTGFSQCAD